VLFTKLDGHIADGHLAPIRQSLVTASSLILTTLFRASLLGSAGMCFAQMLWYTLRERLLPISTIEGLFQIRSNPFELFNIHTIRRCTGLASVALYIWLVPVAVTFPPGALTIAATPFSSMENFNVSTINPVMADDFDPFQTFDQLEPALIENFTASKTSELLYIYNRP